MGKKRGGELSPRHLKFCQEYVLSGNASDAWRKAGYKGKNADVDASKLLVNPGIQKEIKRLQEQASKKFEITQEAIMEELAAVAFARPADIFSWNKEGDEVLVEDFNSLSDMQKAGIASIQQGMTDSGNKYLKVEFKDKTKALELLGKQIGMWSKVGDGAGQKSREATRRATVERIHAILRRRRDGGAKT